MVLVNKSAKTNINTLKYISRHFTIFILKKLYRDHALIILYKLRFRKKCGLNNVGSKW